MWLCKGERSCNRWKWQGSVLEVCGSFSVISGVRSKEGNLKPGRFLKEITSQADKSLILFNNFWQELYFTFWHRPKLLRQFSQFHWSCVTLKSFKVDICWYPLIIWLDRNSYSRWDLIITISTYEIICCFCISSCIVTHKKKSSSRSFPTCDTLASKTCLFLF